MNNRLQARQELYEHFSSESLRRIAADHIGRGLRVRTMNKKALVRELMSYERLYYDKHGSTTPVLFGGGARCLKQSE